MGAKVKIDGTEIRPGVKYDASVILIVLFSIITGSFSLAIMTQNLKIVTESRVAGKMAYDVIDKKADVDPNDT